MRGHFKTLALLDDRLTLSRGGCRRFNDRDSSPPSDGQRRNYANRRPRSHQDRVGHLRHVDKHWWKSATARVAEGLRRISMPGRCLLCAEGADHPLPQRHDGLLQGLPRPQALASRARKLKLRSRFRTGATETRSRTRFSPLMIPTAAAWMTHRVSNTKPGAMRSTRSRSSRPTRSPTARRRGVRSMKQRGITTGRAAASTKTCVRPRPPVLHPPNVRQGQTVY